MQLIDAMPNQVPVATQGKLKAHLRSHSRAPFISIFMDDKGRRRGGGGVLKPAFMIIFVTTTATMRKYLIA